MRGSSSNSAGFRRSRAPAAPQRARAATPPAATDAPAATPDLLVSQIVATQGLKGQVRGLVLTDFPSELRRFREIIVEQDGSRRTMSVREIKEHGRFLLFTFDGIDTIEAAEPLKGALLLIPRDQAHVLPQGHYYISDIVGLEVLTEEGRSLGPVKEVRRTGSNDVYETELALIPAVRDAVVEIDIPQGRMVVRSEMVVED